MGVRGESFGYQLVAFVSAHESWAAPIVFGLTFVESLAFVSLVVPAWAALVGIGALLGASGIPFGPVWVAASVGAVCGDWVSYEIGRKAEKAVYRAWPLSRHPDLVRKGEAFLAKWGVIGIGIGRFFGPLRSIVPLIAGIFAMPRRRFQVANVLSAFVWAGVLLELSRAGSQVLVWLWG